MAQIKPKAPEYRLDNQRPGYRVVTLGDVVGVHCGGGGGRSVMGQRNLSTYVERLPFDCSADLYTNTAPTAPMASL